MPPIEPSLRASLLTGASAIAMSVSASGAHAQTTPSGSTYVPPPTMTFWLEGALAYTGGGSYNVPSLPGLGAPFTSLNPRSGPEIAFGFDYQFQNQPWHFVFDFRFGRSGTSNVNSASSSSSSTRTFFPPPSSNIVSQSVTTNNSTAARTTEREQHLVADFMVGRDLGMGSNAPELQFGLRIADLRASATETATTTSNITRTFYTFTCFCYATNHSTSTSTTSATWNSQFFGIGPRVAVAGSLPIRGSWFFDYGAGIAGLIGDRSFNVNVWNGTGTIFFANSSSNPFVFNSDAMLALSYHFTPHYKFSVGIREDFYANALTSYNINTGGLTNINRIYWGPFARLTGTF